MGEHMGSPLPADRVSDLMANVAKFVDRSVFEPFSFFLQMLVDLDGCFLHDSMRILASTPKKEIFPFGHSRLIILGVECQPQQGRLIFWVRSFHRSFSQDLTKCRGEPMGSPYRP